MAWEDPVVGWTADYTGGVTTIIVLAFISFFSSSILFSYLMYKLAWYLYIGKQPAETISHQDVRDHDDERPQSHQHRVDFVLGIDGVFTQNPDHTLHPQPVRGKLSRQPPNQFFVLTSNLVLADLHQGVALFLSVEWLQQGMIRVDSPTCFAQGLFRSTGDLASSCFITTIAVHTYLSVVRGYMMPHRMLCLAIASIWIFVYAISTIPIAATRNGADNGGFFVRSGSGCWINIAYPGIRLATHSIFIIASLTTTLTLYIAIIVSLRRQAGASSPYLPRTSTTTTTPDPDSQIQLSRHPAFLIYPAIHLLCTLPITAGRIANMVGVDVPLWYTFFAGAMIASNGMLDCMLFGTTRKDIVFASKHDLDRSSVGLETFNFMQTPRTRVYGNMIWVQGGSGVDLNSGAAEGVAEDMTTRTMSGWWWWWRLNSWRRLGDKRDNTTERVLRGRCRTTSRSASHESLGVKGPSAIQMDTVTSVVVEVERDKGHHLRYPDQSGNSADEEEYPIAPRCHTGRDMV